MGRNECLTGCRRDGRVLVWILNLDCSFVVLEIVLWTKARRNQS